MRRTFIMCAVLALPVPAQQLFADPQSATLRPGETTCVTVLTTPSTQGVNIQAQFDPTLVQVSPASAPTAANGRVSFLVTCVLPQPAGTTVTFADTVAAFTSEDITITCAFDKVTLRGSGGSYPGPLALELFASPAVNPGVFGAIFLSLGPGNIPLSLFNPTDPRSLSLDPATLLIPPGFAGLFDLTTFETFAAPTLRVPDLGGGSAVLYAQGMSLNIGSPPQRLSQPQPVYLSPRSTFQDRGQTISLARSFFTVIETGDQKPMIVGGGQGTVFSQSATKAVDIYDPQTDSWTANTSELTTQRGLHTATRLQNGKWLIVGGVDVNNDPQRSAEIYDPATNTFRRVGDMAEARVGHAATLLPNGQVLISGGLAVMSSVVTTTINSALDTTEVFTLDASGCNGTFSPGPRMRDNRAGHTAIPLSDGRIYMVGGVGTTILLILPVPTIWRSTEFLNGSTFQQGPNMATPRAIFSSVQIGSNPDRFLVAGGLSDLLGLGAPTSAAEIYTASPGQNGTWTRSSPTQEMSTPRGIQSAFRFGDQVVQIGGLRGDLVTPIAIDTTDIYTISTGTWSTGPVMSAPRGAYGGYRDPYGVVHIIGGAAGTGPNPPASDATDWYFH